MRDRIALVPGADEHVVEAIVIDITHRRDIASDLVKGLCAEDLDVGIGQ